MPTELIDGIRYPLCHKGAADVEQLFKPKVDMLITLCTKMLLPFKNESQYLGALK